MDKFGEIWWKFWVAVMFIALLIGAIGGWAYLWELFSKEAK